MNRKIKITLIICFVTIILISGCSKKDRQQENTSQTQNVEKNTALETYPQQRTFGSYTVPKQWVFLEEYSNDFLSFYVQEGEEITNEMTNISVEYRKNEYTKEEYNVLTSAILYQLKLELSEELYQALLSESFESKKGYPVFRIEVNDTENVPPVKTIQYYIAGEKAHLLVQVTDFDYETVLNAEQIAQSIVDSFVWNEIQSHQ